MASLANRVWYFVFGGAFFGFWLWYLFFPETSPNRDFEPAAWFSWGLVGFALAAGGYTGRMSSGALQASVWVLTGIASAFVLASWVSTQTGDIVATILTATGGFLLASGIATMGQPPSPQPRTQDTGAPPQSSAGDEARPRTWEPAQGSPSQQQGVTIITKEP